MPLSVRIARCTRRAHPDNWPEVTCDYCFTTFTLDMSAPEWPALMDAFVGDHYEDHGQFLFSYTVPRPAQILI